MVHCRKVRFALFWNFTGILGREIGLGWVPWETHTSQIEGMGKGWEEEEVFKLGLCAAVLSPSSLETYMRTPHWGVAVQPLLILSWNFKVIPNGSWDSQGQCNNYDITERIQYSRPQTSLFWWWWITMQVIHKVLMGGQHLRYPLPYSLPGFLATTLPSRSKKNLPVRACSWFFL